MKTSKTLIAGAGIAALLVLFVAGTFLASGSNSGDNENNPAKGITVTVYKSPTCGCCVGYVGFLEAEGYNVEVKTQTDMQFIKDRYSIPRSMESCHTSVIGDYFIEGHVPLNAVEKLLTEQPDIDGIALPNMPAGSPGMPGTKREPFQIYSLTDGVATEYMTT